VSWRVSIRAGAEADLREAYEWYERQRPGLGEAFLAAAADAFVRLEKDPETCPVYYRGLRRMMLSRFP